MSFEVTRKGVLLLRASAAALSDGTIGEPGWGLAQGLLEMAEALVRASGQPAERFGKGEPLSLEMIATFGERTCCAACGECDGQHESWCIHAAHGEPASGEPLRSPFESDAPERLTRCAGEAEAAAEDAALGELLTWLDLSGLPPVPPEPPAHRRQNWRFDGPEGGEHIPFE